MNIQMLKGKLYESQKTYKDLADALHISITAVNNKMNGKTEFDCAEACIIKRWLPLSDKDSIDIFLS